MLLQAAPQTFGWNFDLSVIVGLLSLSSLYAYFAIIARHDGEGSRTLRWRHVLFFALGISTIFLALESPLDTISDEALFSAHMIQHMLLAIVVPALLLLGIPRKWMTALYELPILGKVLSVITLPLIALIVFNFDIWIWHLPALYEGALRDNNLHIIEHLTFIAAGTLMWMPMLHAVPPGHAMGYLNKIAYLFFNMISSSILAAIFAFSGQIIYPFYGNAPLVFGLSPMDDQQAAGAIMWIPGGGLFLISILITFGAWLNNEDRKAAEQLPQPKHLTQS
jgi:putative membrane protein